MRVLIGGIMHESNSFAATPADRRRFLEGSLAHGEAVLPIWKDAHHEFGGFIQGASQFGFELVPSLMAWATPSGCVDDAIFDEVTQTLAKDCQSQPIDGVLLALHGAMVTGKHKDADTEVLRRIRQAIGPKIPLIATLDFHGNVSPEMCQYADALIGYQTYPHIDQRQRGSLAAELMQRTLRGEIRPVCAVAKRPMMMNILGQATDREPMSSLLQSARDTEKLPGMLSISVMAGFPWSDVPFMGPAIISVSDGNPKLAQEHAERLADAMWEMRHDLYVPCPTPAEAVQRAIASAKKPVLLIDLGDNIGGGSAGDGTVLLAELIKQKASSAIVVLFAPEAVRLAQGLGVGKEFSATVGGALDKLHGQPVPVKGTVQSLHQGTWLETEARHGGRRHNDQGATAIIELPGPITLVLNSLQTPPFSLGQLTSLGLKPEEASIIVVKAAVAYKAAYVPIAGEIIEVDTPGVTAINPHHFDYHYIPRPMFPLDE